ncbi:MAG: YcgN family cysteine cluster protein [Aestuariivirgaceae bacterium]
MTSSENQQQKPFWLRKTLQQMSAGEWESLCDGCGRCCLVKLEDEDTGEIHNTSLSCELLDTTNCRCTDYANRHARVDDCVKLSARNVSALEWLPSTCAYRRVAEGRGLAWWHPLVSGTPQTVIDAGISVAGKVISETGIDEDDMPDYMVNWPNW